MCQTWRHSTSPVLSYVNLKKQNIKEIVEIVRMENVVVLEFQLFPWEKKNNLSTKLRKYIWGNVFENRKKNMKKNMIRNNIPFTWSEALLNYIWIFTYLWKWLNYITLRVFEGIVIINKVRRVRYKPEFLKIEDFCTKYYCRE